MAAKAIGALGIADIIPMLEAAGEFWSKAGYDLAVDDLEELKSIIVGIKIADAAAKDDPKNIALALRYQQSPEGNIHPWVQVLADRYKLSMDVAKEVLIYLIKPDERTTEISSREIIEGLEVMDDRAIITRLRKIARRFRKEENKTIEAVRDLLPKKDTRSYTWLIHIDCIACKHEHTLPKLRAEIEKLVKNLMAKTNIRREEDFCPGDCSKMGGVRLYKLFDEPKHELKTYEIYAFIKTLIGENETESLNDPTLADLLEVIKKTTLNDRHLQVLMLYGLAEEIRMKKLIFSGSDLDSLLKEIKTVIKSQKQNSSPLGRYLLSYHHPIHAPPLMVMNHFFQSRRADEAHLLSIASSSFANADRIREMLNKTSRELEAFMRAYNGSALLRSSLPLEFGKDLPKEFIFSSLPGDKKFALHTENGNMALIFDLNKVNEEEIFKIYWDIIEEKFLRHQDNFYSRWADEDAKVKIIPSQYKEEVLSKNISRENGIKAGDFILDFGVGVGALLSARLAYCVNPKISAVDISRRVIEVAKQRVDLLNLTNIEFVHISSTTLPFKAEYFDRAFALKSILGPDELRLRILKELYRVLKTGGNLIVEDYTSAKNPGLVWTLENWKGYLLKAGFVMDDQQDHDIRVPYISKTVGDQAVGYHSPGRPNQSFKTVGYRIEAHKGIRLSSTAVGIPDHQRPASSTFNMSDSDRTILSAIRKRLSLSHRSLLWIDGKQVDYWGYGDQLIRTYLLGGLCKKYPEMNVHVYSISDHIYNAEAFSVHPYSRATVDSLLAIAKDDEFDMIVISHDLYEGTIEGYPWERVLRKDINTVVLDMVEFSPREIKFRDISVNFWNKLPSNDNKYAQVFLWHEIFGLEQGMREPALYTDTRSRCFQEVKEFLSSKNIAAEPSKRKKPFIIFAGTGDNAVILGSRFISMKVEKGFSDMAQMARLIKEIYKQTEGDIAIVRNKLLTQQRVKLLEDHLKAILRVDARRHIHILPGIYEPEKKEFTKYIKYFADAAIEVEGGGVHLDVALEVPVVNLISGLIMNSNGGKDRWIPYFLADKDYRWIEVDGHYDAMSTGQMRDAVIALKEILKVSSTSSSTAGDTKRVILIVENEEQFREKYKGLLKNKFQIIEAKNGEEAWDIFQKERKKISLVITDLDMDEMRGEELIEKVVEMDSSMPIIVITARGFGGECNSFVPKRELDTGKHDLWAIASQLIADREAKEKNGSSPSDGKAGSSMRVVLFNRDIADTLLRKEVEDIDRFVDIWKNDTYFSDDVAFSVKYQFIMNDEMPNAINENSVYVFNLSKIKTTEELLELFWDMVDEGWTKMSVPYQEAFLNANLQGSSAYKDLSRTAHYDAEDYIIDENIYSHLNKNDLVLDVGVGFGAHIARIVAKRVKKVYGTEISPEIIKQAEKHIQEEGITNIELQLVKNTRLPYESNLFDWIIVSRFFFNLMPKMRISMLDSINRVLKPEGILNIRTYSAVSELGWDVCDWEEYLEKSGFKINRDSVRSDDEKDRILITVRKCSDRRVIAGRSASDEVGSSLMVNIRRDALESKSALIVMIEFFYSIWQTAPPASDIYLRKFLRTPPGDNPYPVDSKHNPISFINPFQSQFIKHETGPNGVFLSSLRAMKWRGNLICHRDCFGALLLATTEKGQKTSYDPATRLMNSNKQFIRILSRPANRHPSTKTSTPVGNSSDGQKEREAFSVPARLLQTLLDKGKLSLEDIGILLRHFQQTGDVMPFKARWHIVRIMKSEIFEGYLSDQKVGSLLKILLTPPVRDLSQSSQQIILMDVVQRFHKGQPVYMEIISRMARVLEFFDNCHRAYPELRLRVHLQYEQESIPHSGRPVNFLRLLLLFQGTVEIGNGHCVIDIRFKHWIAVMLFMRVLDRWGFLCAVSSFNSPALFDISIASQRNPEEPLSAVSKLFLEPFSLSSLLAEAQDNMAHFRPGLEKKGIYLHFKLLTTVSISYYPDICRRIGLLSFLTESRNFERPYERALDILEQWFQRIGFQKQWLKTTEQKRTWMGKFFHRILIKIFQETFRKGFLKKAVKSGFRLNGLLRKIVECVIAREAEDRDIKLDDFVFSRNKFDHIVRIAEILDNRHLVENTAILEEQLDSIVAYDFLKDDPAILEQKAEAVERYLNEPLSRIIKNFTDAVNPILNGVERKVYTRLERELIGLLRIPASWEDTLRALDHILLSALCREDKETRLEAVELILSLGGTSIQRKMEGRLVRMFFGTESERSIAEELVTTFANKGIELPTAQKAYAAVKGFKGGQNEERVGRQPRGSSSVKERVVPFVMKGRRVEAFSPARKSKTSSGLSQESLRTLARAAGLSFRDPDNKFIGTLRGILGKLDEKLTRDEKRRLLRRSMKVITGIKERNHPFPWLTPPGMIIIALVEGLETIHKTRLMRGEEWGSVKSHRKGDPNIFTGATVYMIEFYGALIQKSKIQWKTFGDFSTPSKQTILKSALTKEYAKQVHFSKLCKKDGLVPPPEGLKEFVKKIFKDYPAMLGGKTFEEIFASDEFVVIKARFPVRVKDREIMALRPEEVFQAIEKTRTLARRTEAEVQRKLNCIQRRVSLGDPTSYLREFLREFDAGKFSLSDVVFVVVRLYSLVESMTFNGFDMRLTTTDEAAVYTWMQNAGHCWDAEAQVLVSAWLHLGKKILPTGWTWERLIQEHKVEKILPKVNPWDEYSGFQMNSRQHGQDFSARLHDFSNAAGSPLKKMPNSFSISHNRHSRQIVSTNVWGFRQKVLRLVGGRARELKSVRPYIWGTHMQGFEDMKIIKKLPVNMIEIKFDGFQGEDALHRWADGFVEDESNMRRLVEFIKKENLTAQVHFPFQLTVELEQGYARELSLARGEDHIYFLQYFEFLETMRRKYELTPQLVVTLHPPRRVPDTTIDEMLDVFNAFLRILGKKIEEEQWKIMVGVENMPSNYDWPVGNSPRDFEIIFKGTPECIQQTFEAGHARLTDHTLDEYRQLDEKMGKRIVNIHYHANDGEYDDHSFPDKERLTDFYEIISLALNGVPLDIEVLFNQYEKKELVLRFEELEKYIERRAQKPLVIKNLAELTQGVHKKWIEFENGTIVSRHPETMFIALEEGRPVGLMDVEISGEKAVVENSRIFNKDLFLDIAKILYQAACKELVKRKVYKITSKYYPGSEEHKLWMTTIPPKVLKKAGQYNPAGGFYELEMDIPGNPRAGEAGSPVGRGYLLTYLRRFIHAPPVTATRHAFLSPQADHRPQSSPPFKTASPVSFEQIFREDLELTRQNIRKKLLSTILYSITNGLKAGVFWRRHPPKIKTESFYLLAEKLVWEGKDIIYSYKIDLDRNEKKEIDFDSMLQIRIEKARSFGKMGGAGYRISIQAFQNTFLVFKADEKCLVRNIQGVAGQIKMFPSMAPFLKSQKNSFLRVTGEIVSLIVQHGTKPALRSLRTVLHSHIVEERLLWLGDIVLTVYRNKDLNALAWSYRMREFEEYKRQIETALRKKALPWLAWIDERLTDLEQRLEQLINELDEQEERGPREHSQVNERSPLPDYYAVLGVRPQDNGDTIRKAYRVAALQYHPDRNPGDKKSEQRFRDAAAAWEMLEDINKRRVYDAYWQKHYGCRRNKMSSALADNGKRPARSSIVSGSVMLQRREALLRFYLLETSRLYLEVMGLRSIRLKSGDNPKQRQEADRDAERIVGELIGLAREDQAFDWIREEWKTAAGLVASRNEPGALAALFKVIKTLFIDLALFLKRKGYYQKVRVRYDFIHRKYNVPQGQWVNFELAGNRTVKIREAVIKPHTLLWEAFRAVDHQMDHHLEEITWINHGLEALKNDLKKSEMQSLAVKLDRSLVLEKEIVLVGLKIILSQLKEKDKERARDTAYIISKFLEVRKGNILDMISHTQIGRLSVLRWMVDLRNKKLKEKLDRIVSGMEEGLRKEIVIKRIDDFKESRCLQEPEYDGVKQRAGYARASLVQGKDKKARGILEAVSQSIKEADAQAGFAEYFRDMYVKACLNRGFDHVLPEDIFEQLFLAYLKQANISRGSPDEKKRILNAQRFLIKCWRILFIPYRIKNPTDKKKRIINPTFKAVTEFLQETRFRIPDNNQRISICERLYEKYKRRPGGVARPQLEKACLLDVRPWIEKVAPPAPETGPGDDPGHPAPLSSSVRGVSKKEMVHREVTERLSQQSFEKLDEERQAVLKRIEFEKITDNQIMSILRRTSDSRSQCPWDILSVEQAYAFIRYILNLPSRKRDGQPGKITWFQIQTAFGFNELKETKLFVLSAAGWVNQVVEGEHFDIERLLKGEDKGYLGFGEIAPLFKEQKVFKEFLEDIESAYGIDLAGFKFSRADINNEMSVVFRKREVRFKYFEVLHFVNEKVNAKSDINLLLEAQTALLNRIERKPDWEKILTRIEGVSFLHFFDWSRVPMTDKKFFKKKLDDLLNRLNEKNLYTLEYSLMRWLLGEGCDERDTADARRDFTRGMIKLIKDKIEKNELVDQKMIHQMRKDVLRKIKEERLAQMRQGFMKVRLNRKHAAEQSKDNPVSSTVDIKHRLLPLAQFMGNKIIGVKDQMGEKATMVVGFDGLPGCGKSTLVYLIGEYLKAMGRPNLVLGLDISLKDIEWFSALRKKVIGWTLTPREVMLLGEMADTITPGQPFDRLIEAFDLGLVKWLFKRIQELNSDQVILPIPNTWDRFSSERKDITLKLEGGMIILVDWLFSFIKELQRAYHLRYRIKVDPLFAKKHSWDRIEEQWGWNKALFDEMMLFYDLGIKISCDAYALETSKAVDSLIDISPLKGAVVSPAIINNPEELIQRVSSSLDAAPHADAPLIRQVTYILESYKQILNDNGKGLLLYIEKNNVLPPTWGGLEFDKLKRLTLPQMVGEMVAIPAGEAGPTLAELIDRWNRKKLSKGLFIRPKESQKYWLTQSATHEGCYSGCLYCCLDAGKFTFYPYPIVVQKIREWKEAIFYDNNDPFHYRDTVVKANLADVVTEKLKFSKTGVLLSTSGWHEKDSYANEAAARIAFMITQENRREIELFVNYHLFYPQLYRPLKNNDKERINQAYLFLKQRYLHVFRVLGGLIQEGAGRREGQGQIHILRRETPSPYDAYGQAPLLDEITKIQTRMWKELAVELKAEGIDIATAVTGARSISWTIGRAQTTWKDAKSFASRKSRP